MRTFLYCRVSTAEQTTQNQRLAAKTAGYDITPSRIVEEQISGKVPALERPKFAALVPKLEDGDVLIVTKIDRLGRNASDIENTINYLQKVGVRVVSLDLPVTEVTSAAGDMVRRMFAVFAQFEREQLVERTHAGLARARSQGRVGGRPRVVEKIAKARGLSPDALIGEVCGRLQAGETSRAIAKDYAVSHTTIINISKA